jgi:hypothetical protein
MWRRQEWVRRRGKNKGLKGPAHRLKSSKALTGKGGVTYQIQRIAFHPPHAPPWPTCSAASTTSQSHRGGSEVLLIEWTSVARRPHSREANHQAFSQTPLSSHPSPANCIRESLSLVATCIRREEGEAVLQNPKANFLSSEKPPMHAVTRPPRPPKKDSFPKRLPGPAADATRRTQQRGPWKLGPCRPAGSKGGRGERDRVTGPSFPPPQCFPIVALISPPSNHPLLGAPVPGNMCLAFPAVWVCRPSGKETCGSTSASSKRRCGNMEATGLAPRNLGSALPGAHGPGLQGHRLKVKNSASGLR